MKSANDIRQSGILEQYALGVLDESSRKEVEQYLSEYPELQKDYIEIQKAIQSYAKAHGVIPRKGFDQEITDFIAKNSLSKPEEKAKSDFSLNKALTLVFGLTTLLLAYLFYTQNNENKRLQNEINESAIECDSITNGLNEKLEDFNVINTMEFKKLNFTPTEKFEELELILHNNPTSKENLLQIINLPNINNDQVFQLWSLKDGVNPIPMDIFISSDRNLINLGYEDGTQTYAITIEKAGGSLTPDLDLLIGTVGV